MAREPAVSVYPKGVEAEFPDGPPTAVLRHNGVRLELRFAPGDFYGEGPIDELRLLADVDELTPRVLRRVAPDAELYLAFARSAMRLLGPEDDAVTRQRRLGEAAQAL